MVKLILILGFSVLALAQPWRGPVVENYLRPNFPVARGPAPIAWETAAPIIERPVFSAPIIERPVEVIVEAPRIINPLGYDNYGNANVEHPYAYLNSGNGTTYAIEPEVTHRAPTGYAPVVAQPQLYRAWP